MEDPRDFPRHLPKASVVIADKLTVALVAKHSVAPADTYVNESIITYTEILNALADAFEKQS